jgi:carboxylesterase
MSGDVQQLRSAACGAMLLVHGFNGDPVDMWELEQHAAQQGFETHSLLLPGHGTTARDMASKTWRDWSRAVHEAALDLIDTGLPLVLVGHSMGGALALHEAANNPQVSAIAALCPPLRMFPGQVRIVAASRRVLPYLPTLRRDICDRDARLRYPRRATRWTSLVAAHNLFSALPALRAELHAVRCPTLIVTARHDHVVPTRDGIMAHRLVGSADKELLVLRRSFHVVTKDVECREVFERVIALATRATAAQRYAQPLGSQRPL